MKNEVPAICDKHHADHQKNPGQWHGMMLVTNLLIILLTCRHYNVGADLFKLQNQHVRPSTYRLLL